MACLLLCSFHTSGQEESADRFARAIVLYEQRHYAAAAEAFESLLPSLPEGDARRIRALRFLGEIARVGGRYDDAIRRAEQTVEAARTAGDTLSEGEALNTRGLARAALGRYDEAIADLRASLALHSRRGDAQQVASRLSNLGGVLQMHDRYFEAQQHYERALERTEQSAEEPWAAARRVIVRHNLATLYQRVGRYEKALDLYAGIAEGQNLTPPERARLFANMGALYRRLGDPYKAVDIYSKAERLAVAEHDLPLRVGVLINRGIALALDLGRLSEAEATFDEVIRVAASLGDRRQQVHGLLYRAETRRRAQRYREAERDFEQAHAEAENLDLIEERWKALYGLGKLAENRGDPERAEQYYRQAISWIESLRSRMEADTLRRELLADRSEPYNALIEVLLRSPKADPECTDTEFCAEVLSWISLGRSRNLRDQDRRPRVSRDEGLQQRRDELHAAWKSRLTAKPNERPELDARIESLEREYEAAERLIGHGSAAEAPVSMNDVQRNLEPATVLLVFWTGEHSLLRMWITADNAGYRFGEFSRGSRRMVQEYAEAVSSPGGEWHALAVEVGESLLSGIPALADERRSSLLVFPDSALHEAPLEALVVPGSDKLVIERWSVTDVLQPQWIASKSGAWAAPWLTTLAAFAYSESGVAGGPPALEYAAREVQAIAGQLPGKSHLYIDGDARRDAFQKQLSAPPPLWHFATHAVLHEERPELSRILLAPSGAESSGPDYLFLGEIEDSRLEGIRLAVLSACETELGRRVAGEGVINLSRAFLSAGAESVIAGLWRVPDRETAALMEQLYYELGRGESRMEALRQAKLRLAMAEPTAHPYYWAGFRLTSLTLGPVVRPIPWLGILITLAAALALVAAGSAGRRHRA